MANRPNTWAFIQWKMRTPFVRQWSLMSNDSRENILAFWIRVSEHDEWTFVQLQVLLDSLVVEGEIPSDLQAWALDVAARRRQAPKRRGPKGEPRADFEAFFESFNRQMWSGESQRSIHRDIATKRNKSPEAIESAVKRGGQSPPGA